MALGVCLVEEFADVEGTPVALIIAAPRHDASNGAWRLLFQRVTAYRRFPSDAISRRGV